ncbi:MAG: hypothetical protein CK534_02120 [Nitrospirae bacterium]|nr:MAG: hypothetical protein CK534_02120 [Nitrospirota bacterium]
MRTIAFVHQKSGTGKTTLAIATAMARVQTGARVLLFIVLIEPAVGQERPAKTWGSYAPSGSYGGMKAANISLNVKSGFPSKNVLSSAVHAPHTSFSRTIT